MCFKLKIYLKNVNPVKNIWNIQIEAAVLLALDGLLPGPTLLNTSCRPTVSQCFTVRAAQHDNSGCQLQQQNQTGATLT